MLSTHDAEIRQMALDYAARLVGDGNPAERLIQAAKEIEAYLRGEDGAKEPLREAA